MGGTEKVFSGEDVREVIEWGCGDGGFGLVNGLYPIRCTPLSDVT